MIQEVIPMATNTSKSPSSALPNQVSRKATVRMMMNSRSGNA